MPECAIHKSRCDPIPFKENATEQEFRQQCLQAFADHKALDVMFDQVKRISREGAEI